MNTVMAILLALFAPNSASVANQAKLIAGDQPYCLQVSSSEGYRQARTLSDFSAFSMWARSGGGIYLDFHAVLAVGGGLSAKVYNWSYRKGDFIEIMSMPVDLVCSPRIQFVEALPTFSAPPDSSPQRIRAAGFDFTIPASYRPRIINTISNPILSLRVTAPAFLPASEPLPAGNLGLSVYLKPDGVRSWLNPPPNQIIEERGESIFGLRQRALISVSKQGERREHLELYVRNHVGEVRTALWCSAETALRAASCPMIYYENGLLYHFHLPKDDLGDWQETEVRAARLIASFLTNAPTVQ